MTDNYDQESEHSMVEEGATTEADTSPPAETKTLIVPLDASSQASTAEMEASTESNPVGTLLAAAAHSNCSNSPTEELPRLQLDIHLAVSSMFTTKRSSDLNIQRAVRDFKTSLHQTEVEATAANKEAKATHLKRDLRAKVKHTKAVMKAKYEYHMAIQEARAERCSELEESAVAHSQALCNNKAAEALQCTMLCWEHA